ncbi:hypothetical protein BKA66DRAFT_566367 [Pyrenochaeta sp. MPI-SDFR-AT-0127]|nr:hypothetical protein BKA66DRAFT_566367 [Pyrenochaeta sp. MPI-SDFR-AT-0127]
MVHSSSRNPFFSARQQSTLRLPRFSTYAKPASFSSSHCDTLCADGDVRSTVDLLAESLPPTPPLKEAPPVPSKSRSSLASGVSAEAADVVKGATQSCVCESEKIWRNDSVLDVEDAFRDAEGVRIPQTPQTTNECAFGEGNRSVHSMSALYTTPAYIHQSGPHSTLYHPTQRPSTCSFTASAETPETAHTVHPEQPIDPRQVPLLYPEIFTEESLKAMHAKIMEAINLEKEDVKQSDTEGRRNNRWFTFDKKGEARMRAEREEKAKMVLEKMAEWRSEEVLDANTEQGEGPWIPLV